MDGRRGYGACNGGAPGEGRSVSFRYCRHVDDRCIGHCKLLDPPLAETLSLFLLLDGRTH